MAKISGGNAAILVNGYDLSIYGKKYQISDKVVPLDVTGFTQPINYVPGRREGKITVDMMWDSAAAGTIDALGTPATGYITIVPEGIAAGIGTPSVSMNYMQTNFDNQGSPTEVLMLGTVEFLAYGASNDGVEEGWLVYGGTITNTTTGSATPADPLGAVTARCSGTLHITELCASDTYAVKIQHSLNGSTGWADLVTFTLDGSAIGAEKVSVASGTVNPYRRVVATRTGSAGDDFTFYVHFNLIQ